MTDDFQLAPKDGVTSADSWLTQQKKSAPHWFNTVDRQTGQVQPQPWQVTREQAKNDHIAVQQAQKAAQDAGRLSFEIIDDE